MAILSSRSRLDVVLDAGRTIFLQKNDHLKQALNRRKAYNATFSELSALPDRDLADLGIPRDDIKRIATEAAYDR